MTATADYARFIESKTHLGGSFGFEPVWVPDRLFDFQRALLEWSVRRGRAAILADCGLGKTPLAVAFAENVVRRENARALILTPLAVAPQFVSEGEKFGVGVTHSRDGKVGRAGVYVTNYQRLHLFDPGDFACVVLDESSILKSFTGATRKLVTRFLSKVRYRLLGTATAAPNDWVELGTSSEALGELTHSDMLRRFFAQCDDKKQKRERRLQEEAERVVAADPNYFKKLAFRVSQTIGQWRLKHHAVSHFWRWVASWARAVRRPSDLGFDDAGFVLPPLTEVDHVIEARSAAAGKLFHSPAVGMHEERQERKRTLSERCEYVARLVDHDRPSVVWCHTNDEGDRLCKVVKGARQIAGRTPDDEKEELYAAFASGQLPKLVIKPKIGAWGLNWQHCDHVVAFPSHSYEQHYQLTRRCWRFGQTRPVTVDVVATEGEVRVLANMRAKARKADEMFAALVAEMNSAVRVERDNPYTKPMEVPRWL